jgi:hypothetical protein
MEEDPLRLSTWPQGKHPYVHHDPDDWSPWVLFPNRWLLTNERSHMSLDLWDIDCEAPISTVLERVREIQSFLPADEVKTLWIALDEIFKATIPTPRRWQGYKYTKEENAQR